MFVAFQVVQTSRTLLENCEDASARILQTQKAGRARTIGAKRTDVSWHRSERSSLSMNWIYVRGFNFWLSVAVIQSVSSETSGSDPDPELSSAVRDGFGLLYYVNIEAFIISTSYFPNFSSTKPSQYPYNTRVISHIHVFSLLEFSLLLWLIF